MSFSGNGDCTVGSFSVTSSLPAGVTAGFSPSSVSGDSTGTATVTLTLSTTSLTPGGTTAFTVSASGIADDCNNTRTATGSLSVQASAARPVIDLNGATAGINNAASFTEDGGAVTLAGGANVTDVDSANLASAQVRITNILDGSAESLAVTGCVAGITVTAYNSTTGILALSGSSSLANYQTCLRLVTYNNTDQAPDATARSIEWTVNDGGLNNSPLASTTLSVTSVNDRPVIDLNGATAGINNAASFTEDGGAVAVAGGANVTDVDSANLASAQVRITNILDGSAESLAVTGCVAGITVTAYNSTTGILALSGSSSLANYQTCLRLVTYNNTDQAPDATARSIEWTVNDGGLNNSPLASTTLSVTSVNDAPAGTDGSATINEDASHTFAAADFGFTDPIDDPDQRLPERGHHHPARGRHA